MIKQEVVYENHDPTREGVKYIAIQIETEPPYVWATFRDDPVPRLPSDIPVFHKSNAEILFDFKKGDINTLCKETSDSF